MRFTNRFNLAAAFCTSIVVINTAASHADCCLTDWLFGKGQTSYSLPYTPPTVYVPSTPAACMRDRCKLRPGLPDLHAGPRATALPIGRWPP